MALYFSNDSSERSNRFGTTVLFLAHPHRLGNKEQTTRNESLRLREREGGGWDALPPYFCLYSNWFLSPFFFLPPLNKSSNALVTVYSSRLPFIFPALFFLFIFLVYSATNHPRSRANNVRDGWRWKFIFLCLFSNMKNITNSAMRIGLKRVAVLNWWTCSRRLEKTVVYKEEEEEESKNL